jgi:hypothetical protein
MSDIGVPKCVFNCAGGGDESVLTTPFAYTELLHPPRALTPRIVQCPDV